MTNHSFLLSDNTSGPMNTPVLERGPAEDIGKPALPSLIRGLPPVLGYFVVGSALLTVIALLTRLVCVYGLHLTQYPYGYYLLPSYGDDLGFFRGRFEHLHRLDFFDPRWGSPWNYPPTIAPLYAAFYLIPHPAPEFIVLSAIIVCTLAALLFRSLRRQGIAMRPAALFVALAGICSYPLLFELSRGNMELFNWLIAGLGVYFVLSGRTWAGAVLIGIAGSFKFYPMVYMGILLARRQYRQVLFGGAVAAVATVVCFWFICPDLHLGWTGTQTGLHDFTVKYAAQYWRVYSGVDHSLFALIKRCIGPLPAEQYARILSIYMRSVAVTGLLLFFFRIRKLPVVNQVLCLSVAAILLPPLSFDYTLLHLYTPWALLVMVAIDRWRAAPQKRDDALLWIFVCMTILMSQVGEVILQGDRLGGQIKSVAMVALFALALWRPLPSRFDERSGPLQEQVA